ncbi:MAG: cobalamin-binding protein [Clostridiales bacterium GWB2_37_7]|nr:MAG: cobalamin-binding protein [Clostridiales bacterium GWB2_37_7]
MSELFQKLSDAVVDMDEDLVEELAYRVIEEQEDAFEAIDKGLTKGMDRAGKLFEEQEYFVPELLMCADAMNIGVEILKPHIKVNGLREKHKVVIGVIEGDTHDIGKNLVKLMLETSNFEVIDLGRDVPPQTFIDRAIEEEVEIIMISSLMTTTMDAMADVVTNLREQGMKDRFKVVVGGGPISQGFADKIGADGYSKDAANAVRLCQKIVGEVV